MNAIKHKENIDDIVKTVLDSLSFKEFIAWKLVQLISRLFSIK